MGNLFSFRNKLLMWVMPTLIVGLLSLSAGSYWFINNMIEKELITSMLEMTGRTTEGINTWCKTLVFEPETIAATPAAKAINQSFSRIDAQNINRYKSLHEKYSDIFLDIYAANREGTYHTVYQNGAGYSLFEGTISNREYFRSIMAGGRSQITPPLVSRTTGVPTIFIVAPINDENNKRQGLIGIGISLEYVQKIAEGLKAGKTGYGIVLAKDGTFIYHPNKEYIMTKKISDSLEPSVRELGDLMMSGNTGVYHYVLNGQKKVAFYQPVPFAGWSVATTIPEEELFAPATQMLRSLAAITLVILLLVGSGLWHASRHLTHPLQELASHAQEITAGKFTVAPVPVTSRDEVGILSNNFNIMIKTLQNTMQELEFKNTSLEKEIQERIQAEEALQTAHDNLEEKVKEKTKDLFTVNEELTAMNEEILAINQTLEETNQQLEEEIQVRGQIENELLTRERQYRATTSLLTRPVDEVENCLEAILQNTLQLIKAPDGYIGLFNESNNTFTIHHAIGIHDFRVMKEMPMTLDVHGQVYKTGEILYIEDYSRYPGRIHEQRLDRVSSIIVLPLKQDGLVKAVLAASWTDQTHSVSAETVEILRQFGDLASVSLERSSMHETNRYMALHDDLTGLPNRHGLNLHLEAEMEKARDNQSSGMILFIDVDDLKSINDNFGHTNGDIVIVGTGKHIRNSLGNQAFVARLGGDEFIVVLSGQNSREAAAEVADKIIAALSQDYVIVDQKLHLSASVGVVLYPDDGNVAEDLLKKADIAMYAAKKAGRNRWRFYEPELLEEAYEKVILTNGLRYALEREELFLHYQPQFSLDGHNILGFEALLRWNNPKYGLISPLKFIPLAEQSGLIFPIGQWVLQQACQFARRLSGLGRGDINVAVNISPKQLLADDFVVKICSTVAAADIAPGQITIEVTENALIESIDETIGKLNQLRRFGVSLALDDFGTGYSSLTYLKSLPVDILKIDKSFLYGDSALDTQRHVTESILNLGRALGLTIVAEGVETTPQLELLKHLGCDAIQGYIFSRPVSEEDAISFLTRKGF